ncbi:hypothetical protein HY947_02315 [Candidatus Gottesmanbacteria bacterium]|nr:hypothetical protein [Candidatus Gottesmanbacteria bacterium]
MKYITTGILFCVLLFTPFFFKGQYLFPGSFMVAQYEPWKSEMGNGGAPTIVHKPLADDVFRQLYPMKKLAAAALSKFQMPLWNPYNGSGQPLLVTMHPGFFNPYSLILSFFPDGFGWTLYVFLQVPLLLIGMFLYMRIHGVSRRGSLMSSFVLGLSGFVTVRLVYGDYIYALAYFVWLLASIAWYQNHSHHRYILFSLHCLLPVSGFLPNRRLRCIFWVLHFSILFFVLIRQKFEFHVLSRSSSAQVSQVFSCCQCSSCIVFLRSTLKHLHLSSIDFYYQFLILFLFLFQTFLAIRGRTIILAQGTLLKV